MDRFIKLVIIAGLFFVAGQYIASEPQRISQEVAADRKITVSGKGEVTAIPDIASFTLGVQTGVQKDAETALTILSSRFDRVVSSLEKSGIEQEDIKTTNLSINPQYDFSAEERRIIGFEAYQSVRVKIRNLDKIGQILASATGEGVNRASGLSFDIDDRDELKLEAQELAIEDARERAEELVKSLGVRLGDVKSFSESSPGAPVFARAEALSLDGASEGPPVPAGSQDIVSQVEITFEIK